MADKYADKAKDARRRRLVERSCTHKRSYFDRTAAELRIPDGQKVYECPHCNGWHRTSDDHVHKLRSIPRYQKVKPKNRGR